jgi:hypothetical protein
MFGIFAIHRRPQLFVDSKIDVAHSDWLPYQRVWKRAYNSVDFGHMAQRVKHFIGSSENVLEVEIESEIADFVDRHRTFEIGQLLRLREFVNSKNRALGENVFLIVEYNVAKCGVIVARGACKCLSQQGPMGCVPASRYAGSSSRRRQRISSR